MRYAISLDVGGTFIKFGVVDENGQVNFTGTMPTPTSPDALIDACAEIVSNLASEVTNLDLIDTVGFDVPGIVNDRDGIAEFSANLHWRNFPAQRLLSEATGRGVTLGHDVRSGAFAEAHWGVGLSDFLYVAIGTGIATVVVLNGHPVSVSGWSGEIGQLPVSHPVTPDKTVTLESVASAAGIALGGVERGIVTANAGAAHGAQTIFNLVDTGNPHAIRLVDDALGMLAHSIAPVVAAIGALPVVIGGGLVNRGQPLFDALGIHLQRELGIIPAPAVLGARLGAWSQLMGSGLRAFHAEGISTRPRPSNSGTDHRHHPREAE